MHAPLGFGQALDMITAHRDVWANAHEASGRAKSGFKNLNPEKPLATHTFNL
jgi:hypothetical protein